MIKSVMTYADIIFPLNLGRLTYLCPSDLDDLIEPGVVVEAPVRNRPTRGIVASRHSSPPPVSPREISKVLSEGPVAGSGLLRLIKWMSDYYLAPEGIILKQTAPAEIFTKTKMRRSSKKPLRRNTISRPHVPDSDTAMVIESCGKRKYRTFLCHSPSFAHEAAMASALAREIRNVLIIFPEVLQAEIFFSILGPEESKRACILHGGISKGRRSEYVEGITNGRYDIAVGTRAALFAPMDKVSLIIVAEEHARAYKLEEGVRYNIRDAAVMRGYLENCTVLLASTSPSIDSCANVLRKKYAAVHPSPAPKPELRILNMRYEKTVEPGISRAVFDAVKRSLKNDENVMFVLNRKGHSTLLSCLECGHTEECPKCAIPLVMHKPERRLKCHYCGYSTGAPETCGRCRSPRLELTGTGTQKMQETLSRLFETKAARVDADSAEAELKQAQLSENSTEDSSHLIVGTKKLTRRLDLSSGFSVVVLLNIDSALNLPDFRVNEKAYAEIVSAVQLADPEGTVFIQTRNPGHGVFKSIKNGDYDAFVSEELSQRAELNYPPYSRLLNIHIEASSETAEQIAEFIETLGMKVEILGPAPVIKKKGKTLYTIMLKSPDRKALGTAASEIMKKYSYPKGLKILIDVDPQ